MKFFIACCTVAVVFYLLTACNSHGTHLDASVNNDTPAIRLQLITDAIRSPVEMVPAPDNTHRLFIADLSGKVYIMQNGTLLPAPYIDVSSKLEQKDTAPDKRAIYSIAFHPKFADNKKFYICYNAPADDTAQVCKLVIAEFTQNTANPNAAMLSSGRTVMEIKENAVEHHACQIQFGPDGYLYIAVGDNDTPPGKRDGQNMNAFTGKLLRIDVNKIPYGIPADNPFVGNKNIKPEIWSSGFRRLWRYSFDENSNEIIGADVGDKAREEVDIIKKGGNYGWPVAEGDTMIAPGTADTAHFIKPVYNYTHKDGICIIGGSVYHGNDLPFLKDKYVYADFTGKFFTLEKHPDNSWTRNNIKLTNSPADPFIIFSIDKDENNEMYALGVINGKNIQKGVIYKIVHS